MKHLLKLFLLFFTITFSFIVKGQNLGFDTLGPSSNFYPDSVFLNDSYTHQISIKNYSATALTSTIYLVAAIDSSGILISIDTVGSIFVSNFGLNDTVGIAYIETYNFLNSYKTGDNIVVVWPVAAFASTTDTLIKHININYPASVHRSSVIDEQLLIYPNPFKDQLFIKNRNINNEIKQVRLFDVNGILIYNKKYTQEIKLEQLNKGFYLLEIKFIDNTIKFYKLIKN